MSVAKERPAQLCLAAVVLTISCVQAAPVQNTVGTDEYGDLLDTIFPRDLSGTQYAFAVRLLPSFGLESQLVVKVFPDDSVSAELLEVAARGAWEELSDREQSGQNVGIAELAKTIGVRARTLDIDRETAHGWQTSLLEAVRASAQVLETRARDDHLSQVRTVSVMADGYWYEIWYFQAFSVTLHWDFGDVEPEGAKSEAHLPLTRWIADVMEAAEQRPARE